MEETPYNLLPAAVKGRFRVIYSELVSRDGITIIKNASGKWGVLAPTRGFSLTGYKYLVKAEYESIGFNKNRQLIEAVIYENGTWNRDTNVFRLFDRNGNKVWEGAKGTRIEMDVYGNILIEIRKKFGLLDRNFRIAIEPVHEMLSAVNERYFRIRENNKYGLVDQTGQQVLEPVYAEIVYQAAEKVMVRKEEGNYWNFDLENRTMEELPFERVFRASSNSYGAPVRESFCFMKAVSGLIESEEELYREDEEMVRYRGKWGIVNANGEISIPIEYDYIDFLENPGFFKVCKGELNFGDKDDEERYYETALQPGKAKWGIIDRNNRIVVPIEYDWIDEVGETLWTVHRGGEVFYNDDYQENYWTIRGSKLGVYNMEKLIVPIEYDSIRLNWYRVKDLIYVDKLENEHKKPDIYTFDGERQYT